MKITTKDGSAARVSAARVSPTDASMTNCTAGPRTPGTKRPACILHGVTVDMSVQFVRGQQAWFRPRGIEFSMVSSPGPFLTAARDLEGIAIHPVPMLRRISPFADLVALARILRVLLRGDFDATHAHTPKAGLLVTLAAWATRVPVRVYQVHGLPWRNSTGVRGLLLRASERLACAMATDVICVSESVRNALVEQGMCTRTKSKVPAGGSSNGVDATDRFVPSAGERSEEARALRMRHGIPADAPLACFLGRVAKDKGLGELLDAWRTVHASMPGAHLLIVGPQDDTDPLPEAVRAGLESDASIHLHGVDWNSLPVFHAIDLLVLPTYREGFPNVLLEAAATAIPVVATSVEGCVDAVVDGVTGTLVPARDAHALASAMLAYLGDAALRRRVGTAARERVLAQFSRLAVWTAYDRIYRTALSLPDILQEVELASDTPSDDPPENFPVAAPLEAPGSCSTERMASALSTS